MMERITVRVPTAHREKLETQVENGEYPSLSEAVRTSIREMIRDRERSRAPRGRQVRTDGGNSHASALAAQLREVLDDPDVDDEDRERLQERLDEVEDQEGDS